MVAVNVQETVPRTRCILGIGPGSGGGVCSPRYCGTGTGGLLQHGSKEPGSSLGACGCARQCKAGWEAGNHKNAGGLTGFASEGAPLLPRFSAQQAVGNA